MGYVNASSIRKAGEHLLALLKDSPTIRYSVHFYDGSEETETRIRDALDIDELVAAWQLEKMGYVTTTILDSEMSDGEKDYEISITESGRQVIRSETVLQYCDVDE
jgi:hypothetical protein